MVVNNTLSSGFRVAGLVEGIRKGATAIVCNAGSTSNDTFVEKESDLEACAADLAQIIDACYHHSVKLLISLTGGDGTNQHVDKFVDTIHKHCSEEGYRLNVVKLYAEVLKAISYEATQKHQTSAKQSGPRPGPFGTEKAHRVVSEMGHEPYFQALKEHPSFDIVVAGRAHQTAPYAACCLAHGVCDLGLTHHLGMMMRHGASRATPPSRELLVSVWQHFAMSYAAQVRDYTTRSYVPMHS